MAQSVTRWTGVILLGCAVVALALLPPAPPGWLTTPVFRWRASRLLAPRVQRAWDLSRTLALRDSVLGATASSWRSGARLRMVAASGVPASLVASIRKAVAPAESRRGGSAAPVRVLLAAVEDTLHPVPDLPVAPPRGITLAYLLPQATDGRTCLVIAAVGPDALAALRAGVSADSLLQRDLWGRWTGASSPGVLLGPCAFYGAFGPPGAGVAAWLRSTDGVPALDAAYFVGAASGGPAEHWSAMEWRRQPWLAPDFEACAAGRADRCGAAVLAPGEPWPWWYPPQFRFGSQLSAPGVLNLGRLRRAGFYRLDVLEADLLDGLLRGIGPQRFAALWRSDEALDQAFAAAVGQPLGVWTMHWVQQRIGKAPRGPTVPLPAALGTLLLIGLAVAAGTVYAASRPRRAQ